MGKFDTLCEMMLDENKKSPPNLTLIRHLLAALMAKLESEGRQRFLQETNSSNTQLITFNSFLKIL
jgi:hypothetical protein